MIYERSRNNVCVNKGYKGSEFTVTTPQRAAEIASEIISVVKRTSSAGDDNQYQVFGGYVVYDESRGCPKGGEVVAVISTTGSAAKAIKVGEKIREILKQNTLSVSVFGEDIGTKTIGFRAESNQLVEKVTNTWQALAADYFSRNGIYISTGVYASSGGETVIQAEANPDKFPDIKLWQAGVNEIFSKLSDELQEQLKLEFREAGYNYLRAQISRV